MHAMDQSEAAVHAIDQSEANTGMHPIDQSEAAVHPIDQSEATMLAIYQWTNQKQLCIQ